MSEIHGGEWFVSNEAFGGSKADESLIVRSADGIVATVATIHCGLARALEIAELIAANHNRTLTSKQAA